MGVDPSGSSTPSLLQHRQLRLREGTELLGEYAGSAYEQPTYLVRRHDGQIIHLSYLLYLVASVLDGERDLTEIAEQVGTEAGRQVVADNIEYLVENKLRPMGLIASAADGNQAENLTRSLPLLALRYRARVIPPRLHRSATRALQPLFWPPVVLLVLGSVIALNIWLFGTQGIALTRAVRQLPFHPGLFLLVTVLLLFSGFFHELGHATATRYGGGSPGVMGVGIYLAWPAFYTDLTDSYRLNRRDRLRCDLGGVYFNAVLVVVAGVAFITTGFAPLVVFMVVSQAMAMYQFLPFVRLDGYYIMSDLVGVPNLFAYLGPVLRSIFRRPDPLTEARLHLLKRRARVAIKVWSIVTIVFLAFNFGSIAVLAPIILPAEWAALRIQGVVMVMAFAKDNVAGGVDDLLDLLLIAVAPVGMLLIAGILLRRVSRAIRRWWPTHPKVAAALAILLAGALVFQGQALISRLVPPRPTESGTKGARPPAPARETPPRVAAPLALPPTDISLTSPPSAPARFYVVQPNDTLWSIAGLQLGNPERWPAIYDVNAGVPQPDGRALIDPDLIDPGWRLQVPASQGVSGLAATRNPPVDQRNQTDGPAAPVSVPLSVCTGVAPCSAGTPPPPPSSAASAASVALTLVDQSASVTSGPVQSGTAGSSGMSGPSGGESVFSPSFVGSPAMPGAGPWGPGVGQPRSGGNNGHGKSYEPSEGPPIPAILAAGSRSAGSTGSTDAGNPGSNQVAPSGNSGDGDPSRAINTTSNSGSVANPGSADTVGSTGSADTGPPGPATDADHSEITSGQSGPATAHPVGGPSGEGGYARSNPR